eukprot:TRINITY_DN23917_c0_g1_i1.p1 TRINITY_DN23917_c0_g1~~TRINITY_DN23917_c0_g1_i1.p1  ORF type:complete len:745 (-),score=110.02 TRINITY_DN23917_c0_g1_i1:154-2364(-)
MAPSRECTQRSLNEALVGITRDEFNDVLEDECDIFDMFYSATMTVVHFLAAFYVLGDIENPCYTKLLKGFARQGGWAAITRLIYLGCKLSLGRRDTCFTCFSVASAGIDITTFCFLGVLRCLTVDTEVLVNQFASLVLAFLILVGLPLHRSLLRAPIYLLAYSAPSVFLGSPRGKITHWRPFADIGVLVVAVFLFLSTRKKWEAVRWDAYKELRRRTREVIEQKVLRCKAEFASDVSRSKLLCGETDQLLSDADESSYFDLFTGFAAPSRGGANEIKGNAKIDARWALRPPSHASVYSAPAVLQWDDNGDGGSVTTAVGTGRVCTTSSFCQGADCLPPESLAWIEGYALPQPVEHLVPGQRVLCFDHLGGHLKYAAVVEATIRKASEPADWAHVTLIDGTTVQLTADHPVKPVRSAAGQRRPAGPLCDELSVTHARNLRPGVDSLMVLKLVPEQVSTVELVMETRSRVFLTVEQQERHAIFVAGSSDNIEHASRSLLRPVAVESANRCFQEDIKLRVEKTFLRAFGSHACNESGRGAYSRCYPKSAPSAIGIQTLGNGVGDVAPRSEHSASEQHQKFAWKGDGTELTRLPTKEEVAVVDECNDLSSDGDSLASLCDSDEESEVVLVGPNTYLSAGSSKVVGADAICHDSPVAKAAKFASSVSCVHLSELLWLKAAGLASFGSLKHSEGSCDLCVFENRFQFYETPPCKRGSLCDRCHEEHMHYRKARRLRRKERCQ